MHLSIFPYDVLLAHGNSPNMALRSHSPTSTSSPERANVPPGLNVEFLTVDNPDSFHYDARHKAVSDREKSIRMPKSRPHKRLWSAMYVIGKAALSNLIDADAKLNKGMAMAIGLL